MKFRDPQDRFNEAGDDPRHPPGPPEGSWNIKPIPAKWWVGPIIWLLIVIACLLFVMVFAT